MGPCLHPQTPHSQSSKATRCLLRCGFCYRFCIRLRLHLSPGRPGCSYFSPNPAGCYALGIRRQNPPVAPGLVLSRFPSAPRTPAAAQCGQGQGYPQADSDPSVGLAGDGGVGGMGSDAATTTFPSGSSPGCTCSVGLPATPGSSRGASRGSAGALGAAPGATTGAAPSVAPGAAPGAALGVAPVSSREVPGAAPGVAPGAAPDTADSRCVLGSGRPSPGAEPCPSQPHHRPEAELFPRHPPSPPAACPAGERGHWRRSEHSWRWWRSRGRPPCSWPPRRDPTRRCGRRSARG